MTGIPRDMQPITLFERGLDTMEIANLTGLTEAEVYNALHKSRTRRVYRINEILADSGEARSPLHPIPADYRFAAGSD